LLRLGILAVLYAIPLVVTLRPIGIPNLDPDIWWHLRVGQWVAEHHRVPYLEPFAQVPPGTRWVAYSWLYELLVFGLFQAFGLAGIIVYRAVLSLAVVAALHRLIARRQPHFLAAASLTAAGTLAIAPLFAERPWLFTILFTTLTLDTILDLRAGIRSRLHWALPTLFVLWANIHIQFVYGLFLLALACLAPWIDGRLHLGRTLSSDTAAVFRSATWRRLVLLSGLCALATLVNPSHLRLHAVVVEYATQPGAFQFVNELKAMEFREISDWVVLALTLGAAFTLGRKSSLSSFDVLLLAEAAFLTFRARRDLWFATLAGCAILAPAWPRSATLSDRFALTPLRVAGLAAFLAGVALGILRLRDLSAVSLHETVSRTFPTEAAEFVAQKGYPGPLFNDFTWGGYLIWALPDLPVAIDGRTNLHGDARIERFGKVWSGGPGWADDPDLSAAGVIIGPADSPLAALLRYDDRFLLVYEDEVEEGDRLKVPAVVFVRPPPR
jgi:hypothetical protein